MGWWYWCDLYADVWIRFWGERMAASIDEVRKLAGANGAALARTQAAHLRLIDGARSESEMLSARIGRASLGASLLSDGAAHQHMTDVERRGRLLRVVGGLDAD